MTTDDETEQDVPYVCPGCHAVGEEPCLPGCIDDEIANENRYGSDDYRDDRAFDDGGDDELNEVALSERLDLTALLPQIEALEAELGDSDDYPGARSCVWCRELVLEDFDHDFCEPDVPTEKMIRPSLN